MSVPDWTRGMRMLSPGVYADDRGGMHLDLAELCRAHGFAVTKENFEMLARAAKEECEKSGIRWVNDNQRSQDSKRGRRKT